MSRTAHETCVWQHQPMDQWEGVRNQFIKNVHDGNSMECKLMFSISPPPQGVYSQFTKSILLKSS